MRTLSGWRRELVGEDLRGSARRAQGGGGRPRAPARAQDAPTSSSIDIAAVRANSARESASVTVRERLIHPRSIPLQIAERGRVGDPQLVPGRVGGMLLAGVGVRARPAVLQQQRVLVLDERVRAGGGGRGDDELPGTERVRTLVAPLHLERDVRSGRRAAAWPGRASRRCSDHTPRARRASSHTARHLVFARS